MFLKAMKLSGFKSFVDPVTLDFPSNLTAVVGPNGSGKSNIIDAIAWVLGENSMKTLRGNILTDVIFNGSASRKPVGQAVVELMFDNSQEIITHQYAQYTDISIKRFISRNNESSYYLNNVRCRRRDIVNIFSGTGLGTNSYSIIGQNMVSKIVEAKPEELGDYLEEAAGVAKYKIQRAETEKHIKNTKENLTRVHDLRIELNKQVAKLTQQKKTATLYLNLKEEEQSAKKRLYAIKWHMLTTNLAQYIHSISTIEPTIVQVKDEINLITEELQLQKLAQQQSQKVYQELQQSYYALSQEITRDEQQLSNKQEQHCKLTKELEDINYHLHSSSSEIAQVSQELDEINTQLSIIRPQWEEACLQVKIISAELLKQEQIIQEYEQQWEKFKYESTSITQQIAVLQTRAQHLQQKLTTNTHRQQQLKHQQGNTNTAKLEQEQEELLCKSTEHNLQCDITQQGIINLKEVIRAIEENRDQLNKDLDSIRSKLQIAQGQEAALQALQHNALGQQDSGLNSWLKLHNLMHYPRLAQNIMVEPGWELAVEKVLGSYLQAICIDNITEFAADLKSLTSSNVALYCSNSLNTNYNVSPSSVNLATLLSKITTNLPVDAICTGIYVAEDLDVALAHITQLTSTESIITRSGIWLHRQWIKVLQQKDAYQGILQREQDLKSLKTKIVELEENLTNFMQLRQEQQQQYDNKQTQLTNLQHELHQQQKDAMNFKTQLKITQANLLAEKNKAEMLHKEQQECANLITLIQEEIADNTNTHQQALVQQSLYNEQNNSFLQERNNLRETRNIIAKSVETNKDAAHQLEMKLQNYIVQQKSIQHSLNRLNTQYTSLQLKKNQVLQELNSTEEISLLKTKLEQMVKRQDELLLEVKSSQENNIICQNQLNALEQKQQTLNGQENLLNQELNSLLLNKQKINLQCDLLESQIEQDNLSISTIMTDLPLNLDLQAAQLIHQELVSKIQQLGPINLLAINEYAEIQERRQKLDEQYEDLQNSINTLTNAIAKIDHETRVRFTEFYSDLNNTFQQLFPQIFGGGHATLELSDNNLMSRGVSLIACPPGKRNSHINLLSGGEKTLTGLALIFAIFSLNPAPFCLLDEVDAALDEVNVGRFATLVKTMSAKTQFIFISHNKFAITNIAEYLLGITMHEPGVSKVVSVDIQEALKIAAL